MIMQLVCKEGHKPMIIKLGVSCRAAACPTRALREAGEGHAIDGLLRAQPASGFAPGSRAPDLAVTGTDPAAVGLADLTAGGAALLVFVSEECPTSMMALRNLGPLCRAWDRAGLTATAVFEDP